MGAGIELTVAEKRVGQYGSTSGGDGVVDIRSGCGVGNADSGKLDWEGEESMECWRSTFVGTGSKEGGEEVWLVGMQP